ncbi:MAG: hypothetical protein GWO08_23495 [Gammaproteobacteria bacterium]|nr:hypothetical protein [Gammaproteobacteria bacterium]
MLITTIIGNVITATLNNPPNISLYITIAGEERHLPVIFLPQPDEKRNLKPANHSTGLSNASSIAAILPIDTWGFCHAALPRGHRGKRRAVPGVRTSRLTDQR